MLVKINRDLIFLWITHYWCPLLKACSKNRSCYRCEGFCHQVLIYGNAHFPSFRFYFVLHLNFFYQQLICFLEEKKNSFLLQFKLLKSEIMVKSYSQKYQILVNFDRRLQFLKNIDPGSRSGIPDSTETVENLIHHKKLIQSVASEPFMLKFYVCMMNCVKCISTTKRVRVHYICICNSVRAFASFRRRTVSLFS